MSQHVFTDIAYAVTEQTAMSNLLPFLTLVCVCWSLLTFHTDGSSAEAGVVRRFSVTRLLGGS